MLLLAVLLAVKTTYLVASPLSCDFVGYVLLGRDIAERGPSFLGVYTVPAHIYSGAYAIWRALPIDRPDASTLLDCVVERGLTRTYFSATFESWLFAAIMKLPVLLFDLAATYVIFLSAKRSSVSGRQGILAAVAWQANPLIAVLEVYTTVDVAVALFLAMLVYFASLGNSKLTALATFFGGIFRLVPFLAVPSCLIHFSRSGPRKLTMYLAVLGLAFSAALAIAAVFLGTNLFNELRAQAAALAEVRGFLGPLLEPRAKAVASAVGLNLLFYISFTWLYGTSRTQQLAIGVYGILFFYMAFSLFYPPFLLWLAPFLILRLLGPERDRLSFVTYTMAGFAWLLIDAPGYLSGFGNGLFFIPAWDEGTKNLALFLSSLQGNVEYARQIARSILAAALIQTLIFSVKPSEQPARIPTHYENNTPSTPTEIRQNKVNSATE